LGDALMFTAGIRDFKLLFPDIIINVESNHNFLWENNPYLERGLHKNQTGVEFYEVGYPAVGNANNASLHFNTMFLLDMVAAADHHHPLPISLGEFCASFANGSVGDPPLGNPKKNKNAREPFISLREKYKDHCKKFARQRGDLHMTSEEKENDLIKREFGVDEYWVIAPGGKWDFTAKLWDWRRFQDVIDHFEGKIKFVVVGKSEHLQFELNNVINLLDRFNDNIRGLLPLVYHSTGTVCVPSFLMHLTAAIPSKYTNERKPCVSIFGGREPTTWSWYCNHQILHTNGAFSCCAAGGCWRARVEPLDKHEKHNKSLCYKIVDDNGKKIQ
jgi:ADP-heptose:LPS heptosyltransferase